MIPATVLWQSLTSDAQGLLRVILEAINAQHTTSAWLDEDGQTARGLLERLEMAWVQERIETDTLMGLRSLVVKLDLSGAVLCRAALETLQGHFQRIVEVMGEELAQDK